MHEVTFYADCYTNTDNKLTQIMNFSVLIVNNHIYKVISLFNFIFLVHYRLEWYLPFKLLFSL